MQFIFGPGSPICTCVLVPLLELSFWPAWNAVWRLAASTCRWHIPSLLSTHLLVTHCSLFSTQPWVLLLQAADNPVQSMSFSPDGSVLAATSGEADVGPDGRSTKVVGQLCGAPSRLNNIQQALCSTQSLPLFQNLQ